MTTPSNSEQLDLLISRIAGGEAGPNDWTTFNALAAQTPDAWKFLAQAQRDQQSLSLAVGVALHAADHVDLPSRDAADAYLHRGREGGWRSDASNSAAWARVRSNAGWAVAAVLALAFLGNRFGVIHIKDAPNTAGLIPANYFQVNNTDDAHDLYVNKGKQSGRVLAEMPVLLESHPATTGRGFEVVYVRQILERAQVNDLYRFTQDEANRPIPVRVTPPGNATQAE